MTTTHQERNMAQTYRLDTDQNRTIALQAIKSAPPSSVVEIKKETRSRRQNRLLWANLKEVSDQVSWYGHKLTDFEWKDVFTAALKKQRVVPGIEGGFVVLGLHTSKMSKEEFSELIELIYAFGSTHNVKFSEIYDAN